MSIKKILIVFFILESSSAFAMSQWQEWWGTNKHQEGQKASQEANFCYDCATAKSTALQNRARPIDLNKATAYKLLDPQKSVIARAVEKFENSAAQYGPECLKKDYIMINDLSRGTSDNMSYILKRLPDGNYTVWDKFPTGQGKGVGNRPGSNMSPTGLIKLGDFKKYEGRYEIRNGKRVHYTWPLFRQPSGGLFNYIECDGLEPHNRNIRARGTLFHPITYNTGNTTKGCTGIPKDKFFMWAASLRNSCAYAYDGN